MGGEVLQTNLDDPLRLEPGSHEIEVRIPGYEPWAATVRVQEGRYLSLEPVLKRLRKQKR